MNGHFAITRRPLVRRDSNTRGLVSRANPLSRQLLRNVGVEQGHPPVFLLVIGDRERTSFKRQLETVFLQIVFARVRSNREGEPRLDDWRRIVDSPCLSVTYVDGLGGVRPHARDKERGARPMHDVTATTQERDGPFFSDVVGGLSRRQKTLPCRWLYDERGSDLFEAINDHRSTTRRAPRRRSWPTGLRRSLSLPERARWSSSTEPGRG